MRFKNLQKRLESVQTNATYLLKREHPKLSVDHRNILSLYLEMVSDKSKLIEENQKKEGAHSLRVYTSFFLVCAIVTILCLTVPLFAAIPFSVGAILGRLLFEYDLRNYFILGRKSRFELNDTITDSTLDDDSIVEFCEIANKYMSIMFFEPFNEHTIKCNEQSNYQPTYLPMHEAYYKDGMDGIVMGTLVQEDTPREDTPFKDNLKPN